MQSTLPHPGEILIEEFLKPMGITQYRLAKEIAVSQRRIGKIVAGLRGVLADTGLRLSRFFGVSDSFWIGLQMDFDTTMTREQLSETLGAIRPWANDGAAAQQRVSTDRPTAASPHQSRR